MNQVQSNESSESNQSNQQQEHHEPDRRLQAEHAIEHGIETARSLTRHAGGVATRAAERVPAGVVIVVGGTVLLAADLFGIGEVITAGVAGYAAYRMLRRRARARHGSIDESAGTTTNATAGNEAQP